MEIIWHDLILFQTMLFAKKQVYLVLGSNTFLQN